MEDNINERLINLVRERRPLWDNREKSYADRNVKQNMWIEVAANLKMSEQFVKTRWKSLRDRFMEALRDKGKSGQAATAKNDWALRCHMEFIRDTVTPRNTTESGVTDESGNFEELEVEHQCVVEVLTQIPQETENIVVPSCVACATASSSSSSVPLFSVPKAPPLRPSPSPSPSCTIYSSSPASSPPPPSVSPSLLSAPPTKRSKKDKDTLIDEAVLQYLNNSKATSSTSNESTLRADEHFYLSIAKDSQDLSKIRKLKLRQFVSTKLLELTEEQNLDSSIF